jgi:hypothetical protein
MMTNTFTPMLIAGGLFLGMRFYQEVGRRIGVGRSAKDPRCKASGW